MAFARPFAYNPGSLIPGTEQLGDLSIGAPTSGFTNNPQYWNGPDEDLGYVIAVPVPDNSQPTQLSGITASVGFYRSSALTESSFVELTNSVFGQSFTDGVDAKTWLNDNGYWTSYQSPLLVSLDAGNPSSYSGTGNIWYDLSGNNNDATLINTPTYSPSYNGILQFDDASLEYATIPNIGNLTNWTVEAWFRLTSPLTGKVTSIVSNQFNLTNKLNYSIGTNNMPSNNNLTAGYFDGGWHNAPGVVPNVNTWYQVVGTYDGSTIRQYVNGVPSGGTLNYVGTPQSGGEVRLMRRWDSPLQASNLVDGDLAIVKIYSEVLTDSDVLFNYNNTYSRFIDPTPTPTPTSTNTPTPSVTNTQTPTNTPTGTAAVTPTPTNTETPTNTPTGTAAVTPTPTNTETPTNTPTPTVTNTPTNTQTPTSSPIPTTGYGYNLIALPYNFPASGNSIMNAQSPAQTGTTLINQLTTTGRGFYFNSIDSIGVNRTSHYSQYTGQSVTITFTQNGDSAIYSGDSLSFKYWSGNTGDPGSPIPGTGFVFGTGISVPTQTGQTGNAVLIQSATTTWVTGATVYVSVEIIIPPTPSPTPTNTKTPTVTPTNTPTNTPTVTPTNPTLLQILNQTTGSRTVTSCTLDGVSQTLTSGSFPITAGNNGYALTHGASVLPNSIQFNFGGSGAFDLYSYKNGVLVNYLQSYNSSSYVAGGITLLTSDQLVLIITDPNALPTPTPTTTSTSTPTPSTTTTRTPTPTQTSTPTVTQTQTPTSTGLLTSASYLVIGGGAGGGANWGGGGGAGQVVTGTTNLASNQTYSITVGNGGSGATSGQGSNGGTTTFIGGSVSITSVGGGGGGYNISVSSASNGSAGASGGGGGGGGTARSTGGAATAGFSGGSVTVDNSGSGGGGGSTSAGSNGTFTTVSVGGNGGNGTTSNITGSAVVYAGGGGGGSASTGGTGGTGGGGNGSGVSSGAGSNATGYGSGGGGGATNGGVGGNGSSGVVILSVPTNQLGTYTGSPIVGTNGSNTVLTFTGNGSYTATSIAPTSTPTPTTTPSPTPFFVTGGTGTAVAFTSGTYFNAFTSASGVTTTDAFNTNSGAWQLYYSHSAVTINSGSNRIALNSYTSGSNSWTWYVAISNSSNTIGNWGSVSAITNSQSFSYAAGGFNQSNITQTVTIPANRYFLIANNGGPFFRTIKTLASNRTAQIGGINYITVCNKVALGDNIGGGTTTVPVQFGGSGTGYQFYSGASHVHSVIFG